MVAISFSVFLPKITDGSKTHAIRKERKNSIKQGDRLQLYWKQQSSQCFKIGDAICKKVSPILIYPIGVRLFDDAGYRKILDTILDTEKLDTFAQQDGFDDWDGMRSYFTNNYGLPFHGVLIEWEGLELSPKAKLEITKEVVNVS